MHFGCGTGEEWHRQEITGFYALAYEGLHDYKRAFALLVPDFMNQNNGVLARMIIRRYTVRKIRAELAAAARSMRFRPDVKPLQTYREESDSLGVAAKTIIHLTWPGKATLVFFGTRVTMPQPLNLADEEHMSRKKYLRIFRESALYDALWNAQVPRE